ncbi:hypothetical protein [Spirosoma endophyticum]|uniref:Uncharacterized protein n=1 Tax=Spirosoma endophyticum TaxID=662367 RepID=A0A1I1LYZ7_9BACT|nr:hypothetical protein [Spirosoma endophyticum]SFC75553.1 hypothetical protein SAMN05216167_102322 [Spirosoma endophyticum]
MRSYQSHLQVTQSAGEALVANRKPVLRSSAIFPVLHTDVYSSKVIFMGYWLLKRNIKEVGLLYTLRNAAGTLLSRKYMLLDSAKAWSVQMSEYADLLPEVGESADAFTGSLELEVFSTQDLVFPYPAFVLVYYNENASSVVHTVGRIYNDIEDLQQNNEYQVSESGFDIYGRDGLSPFLSFTNGPLPTEHPKVTYEIVDTYQKATSGTFDLAPLKPYETVFLYLKEHLDLKTLLGDEPGMIRFGHNFTGFFPRFLVGNLDRTAESVSITHSYYDSSSVADTRAYWPRQDERFLDSSTSIPLYLTDSFFTKLVVYPIFSPSDFTLSFRFFDADGKLLGETPDAYPFRSSASQYVQLDLGEVAKQAGVPSEMAKTAQLIAHWTDASRIPTRLKFGLNVGQIDKPSSLPSNICFAPQVGNPKILDKPGTFRWAPFVNVGHSEIVLTNSAPLKVYDRLANVILSFYRESDQTVIERTCVVPPNGLYTIRLSDDDELRQFFGDDSGWLTARADNPFLNGYYFDFHPNGAVAADHLF